MDPRALEQQRAGLFTERTAVNRDVKRLEAQLAAIPEPGAKVPDVEIPVETLVQDQKASIVQRDAGAPP